MPQLTMAESSCTMAADILVLSDLFKKQNDISKRNI
jgi:hypothetical protein